MSLQPGKHITESLRLIRLLGRGAMGSVWLAEHSGLQSSVAVKFMAQAQLDDPVSIQRFRQEAKAAAEIRSPHVVQVFDHGITEDKLPYIVMELLEGESLEKRVKRTGPFSPQEAASIVAQACKALAKAHERGIIHRDIKPPNIFLIDSGGDPFVKVLDFGVAKFSGAEAINMTAAGNMVGTPAFMSPEQLFHGQDIDHRGDLWSLAVCAYYALTGTRPFEGATLGELCVAIKRGEFRRPTTLRNDLPPDVDAWFARAFHQDLAARFNTAKELAMELERAVGASSVMHSTPSGVIASPQLQTYGGTALSSAPHAAPPPRSKRWILWAAAAALVTFGVVGAALFVGGGSVAPAASGPAPSTNETAGASAAPEQADGETEASSAEEQAGEAAAASASASASAATTIDLEEVDMDKGPAAKPPPSRPRVAPRAPKPVGDESTPQGADDREKKAAEELGI